MRSPHTMRARDAATTQFPAHGDGRWDEINRACIVEETSLHAARGFAAGGREIFCFILAVMHMRCRFPVGALSTDYRRAAFPIYFSRFGLACTYRYRKHKIMTSAACQVRARPSAAANTAPRAIPEAELFRCTACGATAFVRACVDAMLPLPCAMAHAMTRGEIR